MNHISQMASVPFKREDRYIVIKRSDLANVPVNYRSALVEPMLSLLSHLPSRECLVIESDWPEYEPTWAAIKARVKGEPAKQPQGEPVAYMAKTLKGSLAGTLFLERGDAKLNPDLYEGPFPVFRNADPGEIERLREDAATQKAVADEAWDQVDKSRHNSRILTQQIDKLRAQLDELQSSIREHLRIDGLSVDGSAARNKALTMLRTALTTSSEREARHD